MIAGPNGAGKSTLSSSNFRGLLGSAVIDPDLPARIDAAASSIETARHALRERRRLLAEGSDFTIETTLSGLGGLSFLRLARERGYAIELFYVGLSSARLCSLRVAGRVAKGGHAVPDADIERRYARSLVNLPKAISMANRTEVYDNSTAALTLVASFVGTRPATIVEPLPDWIAEALRRLLGP